MDDDFPEPFHMALNVQQHPKNHLGGAAIKHRVALGLANPLSFALVPDHHQWGLLPYMYHKLV